ncbi:hypothetical protein [Algoriphagus hitonicola]|uniref:Uncharacterized protein n=1 Tax=Algoriphagus hitonicola TaxID=435880 RepID=A0A1I2W3U2_9BACT|nr:hypothetical protein [Algoriphagus hitonicola]SFG95982.1 hypothetical protein SAMN04487988_111132 [Algoriphagus hitonicola]
MMKIISLEMLRPSTNEILERSKMKKIKGGIGLPAIYNVIIGKAIDLCK